MLWRMTGHYIGTAAGTPDININFRAFTNNLTTFFYIFK